MSGSNGYPPKLDGCDVLPALIPSEPMGRNSERGQPKQRVSHRATANRFAMLNHFVDAVAGELSRSEILVWLVLYRDTRNGIAQTSQADVARRSKLGERTVRAAIRRLEKRKLLIVVYRGGINRGPSKYRILAELNGGPLRQ